MTEASGAIPQERRMAVRSTREDCSSHQSLSTEYGVRVIRSSGIPRDCKRLKLAVEGTTTWSARENNRGQRNFLTKVFHERESREARLLASVPKRNGTPDTRAAKKAIQKEARR